jgi:hypothetical protein
MLILSTATDLLTSLIPFILLVSFWAFIRTRANVPPGQAQILEKFDQIRDEIRKLREAVDTERFRPR